MKLLLMCDSNVGNDIAQWLLEQYPEDIGALVVINESQLTMLAGQKKVPTVIFESEDALKSQLADLAPFDLGVLAWWPKLISKSIMSLATGAFINTHPSMLPHNRGKHYNFWALVECVPFGVSLHFVDEGIDSGDIVAQLPIAYTWEDTGESLYKAAGLAMVELFKTTYTQIRTGAIPRMPQDLTNGSLHYAKEINEASKIDLDRRYTARELLNLLRARTFKGHPACHFEDGGEAFEITVNIKRKTR